MSLLIGKDVSLQVYLYVGVSTYDSVFYLGALSRLDCVLLLVLLDCDCFCSLYLHSLLQIGLDALLRFDMLLFYAGCHLAELSWTRCLSVHISGTILFYFFLLVFICLQLVLRFYLGRLSQCLRWLRLSLQLLRLDPLLTLVSNLRL